jgi:hypothetical protein
MPGKLLPNRRHTLPSVNHLKDVPYLDYPVVYETTVTNEVFYVDHSFTLCTSDLANTSLYKWNGVGWTAITGFTNPDVFDGRGFYSVTTAADASVVVTEHTEG